MSGEREAEVPRIKVRDIDVFPWANIDDALKNKEIYSHTFNEKFEVRVVGEGYICTSNTRAMDARGYVTDIHSTIENRNAFNQVSNFPLYSLS